MAETVTLQIPEALYQRLAIAAGATQRSLEDIILQALQIGSPPTWKDVPEEFQTDLASLDRLDDDSLWQIARSQKTQLEMERYESLLSKQQNAALTDSEKLELDNLRKDSDRFMLRKSQAAAILMISFSAIASEYCAKRRRDGEKAWAPATASRSEYLLSLLNAPIGRLAINEIEPADVLSAIRKIEGKGNLESARRTLQLASAVFRYAVATARLGSDPTRDLRGALTAPTVTHYGAITEASRVGELLRAIDGYGGQGCSKLAMQIAPHVFVRPGELRHADWSEIDLDAALWTIPAEKMKMRKAHHVPLSRQAVALFCEVRTATGPTGYVFPSIRTRSRPMSENTINAGLRRLGYASNEMTAHGFRAMASTLLNECGKWHPDAIERALAHGDSDKVRAAYHRGAHWQERVEMAQWWSDYLDTLRKGADIVSFRERQSR